MSTTNVVPVGSGVPTTQRVTDLPQTSPYSTQETSTAAIEADDANSDMAMMLSIVSDALVSFFIISLIIAFFVKFVIHCHQQSVMNRRVAAHGSGTAYVSQNGAVENGESAASA